MVIARVVLYDLLMVAVAMAASVMLRYHFEGKPIPPGVLPLSVALYTMVSAAVLVAMRQHKQIWRFTSFADLVRLAQAVVVSMLVTVLGLFALTRLADFPRSVPVVAAVFSMALLGFGRVVSQVVYSGGWRALRPRSASRPRALMVGTPEALDMALRDAMRSEKFAYQVMGLFSDDAAIAGRRLRGIRVIGTVSDLGAWLGSMAAHAPHLIVCDLPPEQAAAVTATAQPYGVTMLRWVAARASTEPLSAAELLSRPAQTLDMAAVATVVTNRRVLITGAGGAIGGELARQLSALGPAHLALLDLSEAALYNIQAEIGGEAILADVRDGAAMMRIFAALKPDLVLHAAAIKHVPLAEAHAALTVQTNVGGTLAVAAAAHSVGAKVILISTDKAVAPLGVMGMSKCVAEHVLMAFATAAGAPVGVVRFGNVLGSSGSIIPLFERQIAVGGPITITDPEATRYVMSLPEAVGLVLQTLTLPSGALYVLDMGDPVRVMDLARRLVMLKGLRPDIDIPFAIIGLRPGEKLHEALFNDDEQPAVTAIAGVRAVHPVVRSWSDVEPLCRDVLDAAGRGDDDLVRDILSRFTQG
jgi:O-antigen biosynthesis protein WbqV